MPDAFTEHTGISAPLMVDNIDTDQIIPSREMRSTGRDGLAEGLFSGWRYKGKENRTPNPDFVLNQSRYSGASILISGHNFGCGSSREHAVWALREYGFRVIIAKSFGAIFYENCIRNGIAAIVLEAVDLQSLASDKSDDETGSSIPVKVDLVVQKITTSDVAFDFEFDAYDKQLLMSGLDPIDATRQSEALIDVFLIQDRLERPWAYL